MHALRSATGGLIPRLALCALGFASLTACDTSDDHDRFVHEAPEVLDAAPELNVLDATPDPAVCLPSATARPWELARIDPAIDEASGIVTSRLNPDALWVHNDSGDGPYLYRLDRDSGEVTLRLELSDVIATDWEDIGVGACGADAPDQPCLYVADIGDNLHGRELVTVYRVPEPAADLTGEHTTSTLEGVDVEAMQLSYTTGPQDAEALFVDDEELYILTKRNAGFDAHHTTFVDGSTATLTAGGAFEFAELFPRTAGGNLVTGADWSPERAAVVIRTYGGIFIFGDGADSTATASPLDVLRTPNFRLPPGPEFQSEAVGFAEDGIVHVAEGSQVPIWLLPCDAR